MSGAVKLKVSGSCLTPIVGIMRVSEVDAASSCVNTARCMVISILPEYVMTPIAVLGVAMALVINPSASESMFAEAILESTDVQTLSTF